MENSQKLKCPKCLYSWDSVSRLLHVTCPNCRRKVKNEMQYKKMQTKRNRNVEFEKQ